MVCLTERSTIGFRAGVHNTSTVGQDKYQSMVIRNQISTAGGDLQASE